MLQSSHFFCILFNPIQDFSFIAHSFLLNHRSFSVFIMYFLFVIRIYLLLLLSCFIQLFQSLIFANFSLSFIWNFVLLWYPFSFPISLYLLCVFHLSKLLFRFFLFHYFKSCSHSHREIRKNMHDKGIKWNANPNEPSLRLAVNCCTGPYVVHTDRKPFILRNLILTFKFHIVLARPSVGITARLRCQIKEN